MLVPIKFVEGVRYSPEQVTKSNSQGFCNTGKAKILSTIKRAL